MKLAQVVHDYIALKQSLGFRFHTEATILKAFCNALGEVAIVDVEPHRVSSYLAGSGPVTRHWHRKYEALSGFYRFALGRGYVLHSPLPATVPKRPQAFRPYIYSQEELRDILKAAGEYETPRTALEEATLRTLLLLLYGMLYAILRSEDNALLMGSLLLFSVLALVMLITRKLDWYAVSEQIGQQARGLRGERSEAPTA